jgi:hypothetical protein
MLKFLASVAVAATLTTGAMADDARSADPAMTFAIPSHALHSYVATLGASSDFSVFVDKDCPPELQRMALRKLWTMMPQETAESAYN